MDIEQRTFREMEAGRLSIAQARREYLIDHWCERRKIRVLYETTRTRVIVLPDDVGISFEEPRKEFPSAKLIALLALAGVE